MNVFDLHNLSIGYTSKGERKSLFENIKLSVNKGEFVAVIGANGIGKSTFLRTLSGFQNPLSGSVKLFGRELLEYPKQELALQLSVVLTEKVESKLIRVIELLSIGRYPHINWMGKLSAHDYDVIDEAMNITGISLLAERSLFQLSDGELQKVMIARALVQETPVIILDEPTSHLDLKNKAEVLSLLLHLCREHGKTILVASHEIELALQLADKIILMGFDHYFFSGTPQEVISQNLLKKLFADKEELIRYDQEAGKFIFNLRNVIR